MAAMAEMQETPNLWVSTGEARDILGVSKRVLTLLISKGHLTQKPNIYDRRIKQIMRADVERIARDGVDGMRPPRRKKVEAE